MAPSPLLIHSHVLQHLYFEQTTETPGSSITMASTMLRSSNVATMCYWRPILALSKSTFTRHPKSLLPASSHNFSTSRQNLEKPEDLGRQKHKITVEESRQINELMRLQRRGKEAPTRTESAPPTGQMGTWYMKLFFISGGITLFGVGVSGVFFGGLWLRQKIKGEKKRIGVE